MSDALAAALRQRDEARAEAERQRARAERAEDHSKVLLRDAVAPDGRWWKDRAEAAEERLRRLEEARDALVALVVSKFPSQDTLDAVDDDARSGRRPFTVTLTIAEARSIRAALGEKS